MTYLIDLPCEIHTCQECPFKHTDKGSTKCIFARNGEKLSIRGGTCPIQWHTGEPTQEGRYLVRMPNYWKYAVFEWRKAYGWQEEGDHRSNDRVLRWRLIELFEETDDK